MIRKLILPALAALLLAGCASYQYRDGSGDYYYGQPGTEYRYYGYPYGGYGYGGYGYGYPSYFSYRSYYSYPYGYGGHYRPPYRPPHHGSGGNHHGGHGPAPGQTPPPASHGKDRPTAPWRDLGRLRERAGTHDRTRHAVAEPGAAPVRSSAPARPEVTRPEGTPSIQRQPAPVRQAVPAARPRPAAAPRLPSRAGSIQKRDSHRITEL